MSSNQLLGKQVKVPIVVTIAGTDPSGGAGIQADIKAISATGAYAASIITAMVAQNTQSVQAILDVPADFVCKQINAVFNDLDVQAIKIGMLQDSRIIKCIVTELTKLKIKQVVFDPVMVAKDGSVLLDLNTIDLLKKELFPLVYLITPNIFEAEKLLGRKIANFNEAEIAASQLGGKYKINVLIKGGHLADENSSDVLYLVDENICHWFHTKRIITNNTHGTGCSLSAAIASYLAQGHQLREAILKAKEYLTAAINAGTRLQIGAGNGPIDHFYFLENRH